MSLCQRQRGRTLFFGYLDALPPLCYLKAGPLTPGWQAGAAKEPLASHIEISTSMRLPCGPHVMHTIPDPVTSPVSSTSCTRVYRGLLAIAAPGKLCTLPAHAIICAMLSCQQIRSLTLSMRQLAVVHRMATQAKLPVLLLHKYTDIPRKPITADSVSHLSLATPAS